MNQFAVIPLATSLPACLARVADAEIAAAVGFAMQEKSEGTHWAYRLDFRIFSARCAERSFEARPAMAATVERFLSAQATGGLKASTIGRRAAAIGYAHRLADHEPPTGAETVEACVRGIPAHHRHGASARAGRDRVLP